jgi:hypothetical protein
MQADELEQWLLSLPLQEPCEVEGERVYLSLGEGGAEIGLILLPQASAAQVADALRTGFQGALDFEAGLALAPDSGDLLLNRWLPGAEAWSDVAEALDDLLSQAFLWRSAMASGGGLNEAVRRDDARMRQALGGGQE